MTVRWLVNPRPATGLTKQYLRLTWARRDKKAFTGAAHTLNEARELQARGDAPPTPQARLRTTVRRDRDLQGLASMPVWVAGPRRDRPVARVLYLHGGGYVHPLTTDHWRLVTSLVGAPAEVVVPAYPLAPTATIDEVVPRLLDLLEEVSYGPPTAGRLPLVLMGDSAGGALVLTLARLARERGVPVAGVVSLCPWLDATLADEEVDDLEARDPVLATSGLRAAGAAWAGSRRAEHADVSPVNADPGELAEAGPIDLYIGDRDILRPAVDRFAARAHRHPGVEVTVREVQAMFHVWMAEPIPEGLRTRGELRALIRDRAARSAAQPPAG